MSNHLPDMQPGQRIIVRHHPNGDTEYICRPDYQFESSQLFVTLVAVFFLALYFGIIKINPKDQSPAPKEVNTELEEILLDDSDTHK